jgi:hypothetical protein
MRAICQLLFLNPIYRTNQPFSRVQKPIGIFQAFASRTFAYFRHSRCLFLVKMGLAVLEGAWTFLLVETVQESANYIHSVANLLNT